MSALIVQVQFQSSPCNRCLYANGRDDCRARCCQCSFPSREPCVSVVTPLRVQEPACSILPPRWRRWRRRSPAPRWRRRRRRWRRRGRRTISVAVAGSLQGHARHGADDPADYRVLPPVSRGSDVVADGGSGGRGGQGGYSRAGIWPPVPIVTAGQKQGQHDNQQRR